MGSLRSIIGEAVHMEDYAPASELTQNIMETVEAAIGEFDRLSFQKNRFTLINGKYVQTGLYLLYYEPIPDLPPQTANCRVGFSLCSPQDEFCLEKGIRIAEDRMELWKDRVFASCASDDSEYVFVPPGAVSPLYHLLTRVKDLLGSQIYLPHWAYNFTRLVRGKAQRDFPVTVPEMELEVVV